ncbi:uncharacterized protein LOC134256775 isoform X1 [Saccostrea cucullata]|uniref:uncharacterized protein LOC134256775 isoform X1 n=1 Tax=Saccostrea cuccullata TaxID=36930 RepID=UPI002ED2DD31
MDSERECRNVSFSKIKVLSRAKAGVENLLENFKDLMECTEDNIGQDGCPPLQMAIGAESEKALMKVDEIKSLISDLEKMVFDNNEGRAEIKRKMCSKKATINTCSLETEGKKLTDDVNWIKAIVTKLDCQFQEMKEDIKEVKMDISSLKRETKEVNSNLVHVKEGCKTYENRTDAMQHNQSVIIDALLLERQPRIGNTTLM